MTPHVSPPSFGAVLRESFRDSYLVILTFVVMFIGVGQMSSRAGLDALQTVVMTALTLAAPAQAAAMSILISAGGSASTAWITALTAVVVINLRFIVMVASVLARLPKLSIGRALATLGLLSASSFAVIFPRLIDDPPRRPALYAGTICAMCSLSAVVGALIGNRMSGAVSPLLGATLGAVIPIYFAVLIAAQWKNRVLMLNAAVGAVAVPLAAPYLGSSALLVVPLGFATVTTLVAGRRPKDA